jgi:hypothetical protein
MRLVSGLAVVAAALAISVASGHAGLLVTGDGITGDYTVADGTSLWSLISGVQTPVAPGYNAKNKILHNYVVAESAGGAISVFSAGELNPSFGGTNTAPTISVSGSNYTLVDPNAGAGARGVTDLTSLTVIAVPALASSAGGVSSSFTLSGLVTNPGTYAYADLQAFPAASATVSGSTYDGTSLYGFLDPANASALSAIVAVGATDGYLAVFSLAELDPALGGNPNTLLAFAGATFPGAGVARIVTPDDNMHGRWVSNIDSIGVSAVPEAPAWAMLLAGFAGLGLLAGRARRTLRAA